MTPQNRNLPNNAAATSVPDKNLAGLEVYGNQEEKTWEEEPGRIGSLWKSRGKTWEDWKSRGICSKRKCFHCVGGLEEKIRMWKDRLSDLQKSKVNVKVEVILHICFTFLFHMFVLHTCFACYFTYSFQIFLSHICFVFAKQCFPYPSTKQTTEY